MEISRKRKLAGDRLIDLPDSLLHAILSQLTAREVVQTCALSRRWRHVWLSAPYLDIDFQEFKSAAAGDDKTLRQDQFDRFEDFADNLLCRRSTSGAPLDTLRLRYELPRGTTHGRWLRRGLKCCPAVLDITHDAAGNHPISLPRMGSGARHLKKLRLHGVGLPSDFEEQLRSEFRALEDLEMRNCRLTWLSRIASNTLKKLTVERPKNGGKLLIAAPHLASLHIALGYRDGTFYDITVGEAPSLAEASICVRRKPLNQRRRLLIRSDTNLLRGLCKLLGSLSNVNSLVLTGFQEIIARMNMSPVPSYPPASLLQAILDEDNDRLPTFRNLGSLELHEILPYSTS